MKIKTTFLYFAVISLIIVSYQSSIEPRETETIIDFSMREFHIQLLSGLSMDIYELEGPPSTEPMVFTPVSGKSQGEILAVHEVDRKEWFPDNSFFEKMDYGMKVQYEEGELIAQLKGSDIEVIFNDEVIYSADTGIMSPIMPLRSLWSYDENWVLG